MSLEDRMHLSEDRRTIHMPLLGLQIPAGTVNVRTTQGERTARRAVMDIGFLDDPRAFALATKRMQAQGRLEKPSAEAELRRVGGRCFIPYLIQAPDGLVQMVATTYWDQRDDARNTFVRGHEYGHAVELLDELELLEEAIRTETGLQFQLKGYRSEVVASIAGLFALHRKGYPGIKGIGTYTALDLARALWAEKALLAEFGSLEALDDVDAREAIRKVALARSDPKTVVDALVHLISKGRREEGEKRVWEYDFSPELNKHTPIDRFFSDFERAIGETRIDLTIASGERMGLRTFMQRMIEDLNLTGQVRSATYTMPNLRLERAELDAYLQITERSKNLSIAPPDERIPAIMEMVASLAVDDYEIELKGRGWKGRVAKELRADALNLEFDIVADDGSDELEITISGSNQNLANYFFQRHPIQRVEYFVPAHTSERGNMILGVANTINQKGHDQFVSACYAGNGSTIQTAFLFSYFFPRHTINVDELVRPGQSEGPHASVAYEEEPEGVRPVETHIAEVLSYAPTELLGQLFENGDDFEDRCNHVLDKGQYAPNTAPIGVENNISVATSMERVQGARMADVGTHWRNAFYEAYGEGALIKTTRQTLHELRCVEDPAKQISEWDDDPRIGLEAMRFAYEDTPDEIKGRKVVELGSCPAYILFKHGGVQLDWEVAKE